MKSDLNRMRTEKKRTDVVSKQVLAGRFDRQVKASNHMTFEMVSPPLKVGVSGLLLKGCAQDNSCNSSIRLSVDKLLSRLLFPGRTFNAVPIRYFHPRSTNDSDWVLGQLKSGEIDLTSFSLLFTSSRYDFWPRIVGPWDESQSVVLYTAATFVREPSVSVNGFQGACLLALFALLHLWRFVEQQRSWRRPRSLRLTTQQISSKLFRNLLKGFVTTVFIARHSDPKITSIGSLIHALEMYREVELIHISPDAVELPAWTSEEARTRWEALRRTQMTRVTAPDSFALLSNGSRVLKMSGERGMAKARLRTCDLRSAVLEDRPTLKSVAYVRSPHPPRLTDRARTLARELKHRMQRRGFPKVCRKGAERRRRRSLSLRRAYAIFAFVVVGGLAGASLATFECLTFALRLFTLFQA